MTNMKVVITINVVLADVATLDKLLDDLDTVLTRETIKTFCITSRGDK